MNSQGRYQAGFIKHPQGYWSAQASCTNDWWGQLNYFLGFAHRAPLSGKTHLNKPKKKNRINYKYIHKQGKQGKRTKNENTCRWC